MTAAAKKRSVDWYTVSVDSLRGIVVLVVLAVLAVVGARGYLVLRKIMEEREYTSTVAHAEELVESLRYEKGLDSYRGDYEVARRNLIQARELYGRGELRPALDSSESARTMLLSIQNALDEKRRGEDARFIAVEGKVDYRRGERGPWQQARNHTALGPGDYVKTSTNGSAEIILGDGALYTVRSETLILVGEMTDSSAGSEERTINLEGGLVDLDTGSRAGRVTTPDAEALVLKDSSAIVGYDESSKVGRFANLRGGMQVEAKSGESRSLGPLEQVVVTGREVSNTERLVAAPALLEPADNFEVELEGDALLQGQIKVTLRWEPVEGADRYALQVGRNRLFVDNIVDVIDREVTQATLELRLEGVYLWRVAAYDKGGTSGPWSSARKFRATDRSAGS